jgi:hypothetical protein
LDDSLGSRRRNDLTFLLVLGTWSFTLGWGLGWLGQIDFVDSWHKILSF